MGIISQVCGTTLSGGVCVWLTSEYSGRFSSAFGGCWNRYNCRRFFTECRCFRSSQGASQLATRKAPGARGVRGGLSVLWRRHRQGAGCQAGAFWSRLSGNQQGERKDVTETFHVWSLQALTFTFFVCLFVCRRWTLWSVRSSFWRTCATIASCSITVAFGTTNRGNSPFLSNSCLGYVLYGASCWKAVQLY